LIFALDWFKENMVDSYGVYNCEIT